MLCARVWDVWRLARWHQDEMQGLQMGEVWDKAKETNRLISEGPVYHVVYKPY